MARRFIPAGVEDITPQWLNLALTESGILDDNLVRSVRVEPIGEEQGYMGILARLFLEYDRPDEAVPATMIVKMPTREWKNKITGELFLNYERENRMYEEILPGLPLRTPRCYYADMDPGISERTVNFCYLMYEKLPRGLLNLYLGLFVLVALMKKRRYVLLIEDFGDLDAVNQLDGCCFEDARQVMKPLGLAQAAYWGSPQVDRFWLKHHSEISNLMGLLYERGLPVVSRNFPDMISDREREVFDWLARYNKRVDDYVAARPATLVHSDFRLDNVFFDRARGEIAVVDWQTCYRGLGVTDPAYFCLHGGESAFTPDQARELIEAYHQGLVEGGVSEYTLEDCLSDYQYGLLIAIRYVMIIFGALELDNDPNAQKLAVLWLDRMRPLVESVDTGALFNSV